MMKLEAYTMDEWRERLNISSDKGLGQYFGKSATSVQHYRNNGVLIADTDEGFKRVSNLRES
jgi:hypothetical protein